jgi:hypothetical protein
VPDASRCPYLKRIRIRMRVSLNRPPIRSIRSAADRADFSRRSPAAISMPRDVANASGLSYSRRCEGVRSSRSQRLAGRPDSSRILVGTLVGTPDSASLSSSPRVESPARVAREARRQSELAPPCARCASFPFRGRGDSGGGSDGAGDREGGRGLSEERKKKKTLLLHRSGWGKLRRRSGFHRRAPSNGNSVLQTSTYYQRRYHISGKSYADAGPTLFD